MKIKYVEKNFREDALKLIKTANAIITEYQSQNYELTLRQLYYQFVARDIIENKQSEYKRLGAIINDARLAGLISWKAIVDRTRNLEGNPHWLNPRQFMESVTPQFQMDKWENQQNRVEVWVEKDALVGIVESVARKLDVSYFSCRGYTSQSEMWSAAQRLESYCDDSDQTPVIIHLGDHDPSGIDMTRDIFDRLELFADGKIEVNRIALTRKQIDQYDPPPNPAKITDSRAADYIKKHGNESWELDALDPKVLTDLISETVISYRDEEKWEDAVELEDSHRNKLLNIARKMKYD